MIINCSVMREQWIRAKYERREFVEGAQVTYLNGHKEGPLMKRGKAKKNFQRRRFVLDTTENTLKYYKKDEVCFVQEKVINHDKSSFNVRCLIGPNAVSSPPFSVRCARAYHLG